ncbi:protein argonaute-4-like [Amblyomma americanum]
MATGHGWKVEDLILRLRNGSNIIIVSTSNEEAAQKIRSITQLNFGGTLRGVIYGVDQGTSPEELKTNLRTRTQGVKILAARMLGNSSTAVITFDGPTLPKQVLYYGGEMWCYPYRPTRQVCYACGQQGHRMDVCPFLESRTCRQCGCRNPEDMHQCTPKCLLCGGDHAVGTKDCKQRLKPASELRWGPKQQQRRGRSRSRGRRPRWFRNESQELERTLSSHFPRQPAHGHLCRTRQLLANHFSIQIPTGSVYHYDVDIFWETAKETKVPEQKKYRCLSTKINRIVIELLVKKYRQDLADCIPAFDGRKNLYTRRQLNFRERTFTVDLEEDQRTPKFNIKIQYVATVSLDARHGVFQKRLQTVPQEVLQAIDIVFRHSPSIKVASVGRLFFRLPGPNEHNDLAGGREVWFGYSTSVRPVQWKPVLNVDMSATAFYESLPLIDFLCRFFSDSRRVMTPVNFRSLHDNQYARLNRELKGLRVKVTHLPYPRKYKVVRITKNAAKDFYFESEGSQISVADYFQSRYSRLSYPNFPCVQSGSPTHPVYIPLEVCELAEG